MKPIRRLKRLFLGIACVLPLSQLPAPVLAATVNLATSPLANSNTTTVKPNVMFILDDSGSMANPYMPDEAGSLGSSYGMTAAQCNGLAYNPTYIYTPPVYANGSSYPNASFTNAKDNGYCTSSCTTRDLTGKTYYTYSGSQTALSYTYTTSGVNTTTTFYKECNNTGSSYSGLFSSVTVSSTSGPGGFDLNGDGSTNASDKDERQNYANWWSYYRTRLMMMKTGTGLAFKNITNNYRVGFTTINNTGVTDGSEFLHISDFTSDGTTSCSSVTSTNQKQCWYSKLYGISANSSTPLRGALSKVGQMFAGMHNGALINSSSDPMQYSCQQNFAILSTDGYWNTGNESSSYGPYKLDNSTAVGQQDGGVTPRPLLDGAVGTTTTTTTTTATKSRTDTYTKTWKTSSGISCGSFPAKVRPTINTQTGTTTETQTDTTVVTVVTINGTPGLPTTTTTTTNTFSPAISAISWSTPATTAVDNTSCIRTSSLPTATATSQTSTGSWGATTTTGPTTTTFASTSGGSSDSLADVAMYYYNTDLRTSTLGNCTSYLTGADLCTNNVTGTTSDPTNQQHMTTFTVGLGVNGLVTYSPTYATDTSGDFYNIKTGLMDWPDPQTSSSSNTVIERIDDLWHAAVDGHGTYFSAKSPASLTSSLNGALSGVSAHIGFGTTAATSNLDPVTGDNAIFLASYTTGQWTGNLQQLTINPANGHVSVSAVWCTENIAADAANGVAACTGTFASPLVAATSDTRTIKFNNSGTLSNFTWANLGSYQSWFYPNKLSQYSSTYTTADQAIVGNGTDGTTLVNFLRGQSQYENQSGSTANLYRDRVATMGDVVDSSPVYVKKPYFSYTDPGYSAYVTAQQSRDGSVYVGANDGMLHAFNSTNGTERWAYVPTPVMENMYWLADFNYASNHHFLVNGKTSVMDVCTANCTDPITATWRTILVGALGGGGRGYYALDVTNPASPTLLWEFTSLNDADVGYSFGNPVAVKQSNGTWVVLLTSGYNNVTMSNGSSYDAAGTGHGFLFVVNPLNGNVIRKIDTGVGSTTTPSGLAKIAPWVNSGADATALYVYGGDLLGNVWRFDINTGAVLKIATLTDAGGTPQPITTKPELGMVSGQRVIFVSTGKYLEASDLPVVGVTPQVQSVYALKDSGATLGSPRTALVQQTITDTTVSGQRVRTVTNNAVDFTTGPGWFADFPVSGERSNVNMQLVQGTLLVPTNVPTNGACDAGGESYLNYLNYATGSYVPGATTAGMWTGTSMITGMNVVWINGQPQPYLTKNRDGLDQPPGVPFNPSGTTGNIVGHRVTWRELISQ